MILCLICSVTAVSAVDINETTNQASTGTLMAANIYDNSTGGTLNSNGNEVLAAGNSASGSVLGASGETGSFTDLDALIKLSGDNLVLYQNYAYNPDVDGQYSKDGIVLTKTIHINGNEYSIDGSNLVNVFTVDADDVVLDNLYLVNTNGDNNTIAGSILWNGKNGELINCHFENSTITSSEEAISAFVVWQGSDGLISNCSFKNTGTISSGSSWDWAGGVCSMASNLRIEYSSFDHVTRPVNFIAACAYNVIYKSNITDCAGAFGGRRSDFVIDSCRIIGCTEFHENSVIWARGGYTLKNSYLSANSAYSLCNALYTIDNCTFESNKITGYELDPYSSSSVSGTVVSNCRFINEGNNMPTNSANNYAIVNMAGGSGHSIYNCNFTGCTRTAVVIGVNYCTIDNCRFESCNVKRNTNTRVNIDYGVVRVTGGSYYVINNSYFKDNTAITSAIWINSAGSGYVNNITYINNKNKGGSVVTINRQPTSVYTQYDRLYVNATGTGSGLTPDDRISLDDALAKISYGGTLYLQPDVYTFNTRKVLNAHIIGEGDGVIIDQGSFELQLYKGVVKNIIFNNTKKPNLLWSSFDLSFVNCSFKNIGSLNGLIRVGGAVAVGLSCINITVSNSNFNYFLLPTDGDDQSPYSKQGYDDMARYTVENMTISNSTFNTIIPVSTLISDTFRNITVENSNFAYILNQYCEYIQQYQYGYFYQNLIFEDIDVRNCNITGAIIKTLNHKNVRDYSIGNIDVVNCNFSGSTPLFEMYYNNVFKNISVVNLNNTGVFDVFFVGNAGNVIGDVILDNFTNPINMIVNASSAYVLGKLSAGNVTGVSALSSFDSMIFNGLTFSNVNFTSGIILTLSNDMVLSDSSFTDFMGHVVVAGNNIVIRDTNFTRGNNSDLNGSAVYAESGDFLTIENCRFISNNASYGGAVYSNANPTTIMNSVFEDNRALANNGTTSCGGAIYIGDVYNSIDDFTKSYLNNTINYNDLRLVNPNNTLFTVIYVVPYWQEYKNNESLSGDGSGKDINNPTNISDARIKAGPYCKIYFINNDNWNSNYYNMTNATINPDNVVEFVVRYSGMVFYGNNSIIDNLYFTVNATNATFKDLTFTNNTGHSALVINQENTVVDNCTFLNNGGDAVSAGAAIQVLANNTSILNSTFTGNIAGNVDGANGGAVFINASYISIGDCHFSDNRAYATGSHLFVVDDNELRDISLIDCNFTGGSVSGSGMGSGVYLSGDNLVVYNSNFTDNIGRQGAGLTVTGSTINLNITGNNFTDNRAVPQTIGDSGNFVGGAVFFDSSRGPISIVDNIFTGNNASVGGGALYINNMPGSGNTFAGNVFTDNHALGGNGGAVYVNKVDYLLTLSGGEFTDNNASGNGGALYVNASVNINDASFNGNNATLDGGAIYNNNTLSLNSNAFNGNGAVNGGAIYNNGVLVDKRSRYNSNNATQDGGAIYSKSDLDYTAASSTSRDFVGNSAVNGGALYINGTNNNIRGAYFTDNRADYGSCIYVENNTDLNVYDVSIVNNHVTNGSQENGGHGDIYLGNVVNFAIPDDRLYLEPKTTGSSEYNQYIYNSTGMVRSDVLYVSESGTGLGLMSSEPTTLDKALQAINDNGRIVFVESYMLNTTTINRNVTLAGYNNTISMKRNNTTAGENKYLFNPLKKIKNLSLNNYLSSQSLRIKKIKNVQNKYFH